MERNAHGVSGPTDRGQRIGGVSCTGRSNNASARTASDDGTTGIISTGSNQAPSDTSTGTPSDAAVRTVCSQNETTFRAAPHQPFGLRHDFLGTILPDHAHAGIDRGHDLTDVTGFGRGEQSDGTGVTTGGRFGRRDAVQHAMHAVRDLRGARVIDHFIGKILMVHISGHLIASSIPFDFDSFRIPALVPKIERSPYDRPEVKR